MKIVLKFQSVIWLCTCLLSAQCQLSKSLNSKQKDEDIIKTSGNGVIEIFYETDNSELELTDLNLRLTNEFPRINPEMRSFPVPLPFNKSWYPVINDVSQIEYSNNFKLKPGEIKTISIADGIYYAILFEEKGYNMDSFKFFFGKRFNKSFFAMFGYKLDFETINLSTIDSTNIVKNHDLSCKMQIYYSKNFSVCPALKIENKKKVKIKIQPKNIEINGTTTFLTWIPGLQFLMPLYAGRSYYLVNYEVTIE